MDFETNNDQPTELLRVGKQMLGNGFSIIPIDRSTKKPLNRVLPYLYDDRGDPVMGRNKDTGSKFHRRGWKPYQENLAWDYDLERWHQNSAQLAVVCGQVSGGLLIIDFDKFNGETENMYERWVAACEAEDLMVSLLPTQRTGSGGYQVAVRCDNPGENTKLAWAVDVATGKPEIAIETRAEGGYAVIAPSLHPSGNQYCMVIGQFYETPKVNQEEVDRILDIARSFSQVPEVVRQYTQSQRRSDIAPGESVIDNYNASTDIRAVLPQYGYTDAGDRMHRPMRDQTSEPSVTFKDNKSFHHSSNDGLSDGYWHTPFSVRLHYEFGGNLGKAVAAIAKELGMERRGAEPVMRAGVACCPDHPTRPLKAGNKGGFYCSERVIGSDPPFCGYYWKGEDYTIPAPVMYKGQSKPITHAQLAQ